MTGSAGGSSPKASAAAEGGTGTLGYLLEYEQVVNQILKAREEPKKRWWQTVEVLSLFTSLVIALASLLLAPLITARTQKEAKRFEADLARRDQLVAQERDAASATDDLLSVVLKGTEDRLATVRGEFNGYPEPMRDSIVNASNAVDARWRTDQFRADFQLNLYFGEDSAVVGSWGRALADINNYALCVERLYKVQHGRSARPTECAAHQAVSLERTAELRKALVRHFHTHHAAALDIVSGASEKTPPTGSSPERAAR
jgi:hypothetical protein